MAAIVAITNVYAQDDFYPSKNKKTKEAPITIQSDDEKINDSQYSTATDYYIDQKQVEREAQYNQQMGITDSTTYYEDENGNTRITNNYYNGDNYDYDNEYYDYEYSSRIRRFHRPYSGYGYYDNCYTNYYWYDYNPYNYGVSVYTSYGWWYPRPWGWNVGWSWGSGWYAGWGIGWGMGWGGGYYGSSYWSGYNHGYNHGYNDGYYAGNYYNSYDKNSYYYGHRGNTSSGYGGYGHGTRPSGSSMASMNNSIPKTVAPVKTFGEKYEMAVRNNTINNVNGNSSGPRTINEGNNNNVSPRSTSVQPNVGGSQPRPNPYINPKSNVIPRTSTEPNGVGVGPKPRTTSEPNGYTPSPRNNSEPNVIPPKPRTTNPNTPSSQPTYNQPRNPNQGGGGVTPKPRTYSKPTTQPNYSKPSNQNYNKPSNSYSRPSGNSYNRGGSAPSGGGGGGRKPR
ncbi:MAG: hypothetical protein HYU68_00580 [Bacteroidetes bacterium]|nr:hypothetical protein [Bacteroidota bacterium]